MLGDTAYCTSDAAGGKLPRGTFVARIVFSVFVAIRTLRKRGAQSFLEASHSFFLSATPRPISGCCWNVGPKNKDCKTSPSAQCSIQHQEQLGRQAQARPQRKPPRRQETCRTRKAPSTAKTSRMGWQNARYVQNYNVLYR